MYHRWVSDAGMHLHAERRWACCLLSGQSAPGVLPVDKPEDMVQVANTAELDVGSDMGQPVACLFHGYVPARSGASCGASETDAISLTK